MTNLGAASCRSGLPRAVEVALSGAGLVALGPLMATIGALVRLDSRGPALFRQERVGRGGTPFTLVKFRTMTAGQTGPQITAKGDQRVTTIGRVLRKTKLDELPELYNILRGDMSFVGPRPEVPKYVRIDKDPLWKAVLAARPGLTDPVTLSLRNEEELLATSADPVRYYEDTLLPYKLAGYVAYLERRSWRTDVAVIARTLVAVVAPSTTRPPNEGSIRAESARPTAPKPDDGAPARGLS